MKRILAILPLLLLIMGLSSANAQQQTQLTQYNFNPMIYNPAYAGFEKDKALMLTYRRQWASVEGTPTTIFLSGTARLRNQKHGVGATVLSDRFGVSTITGFNFSYSYKIISDSSDCNDQWNFEALTLSVGAVAGIDFYSEDYSELGVTNDPRFAENIQFQSPGAGIGAYFSYKNFFGGVSTPRFISTTLGAPEGTEYNRRNHWYLTAGKIFAVNPDLKIKGSFLAKDVSGGPAQIDFLANALIKEALEVGMSYRTNSSVNFTAGYHWKKKAWLGYSYDVSVVPEVPSNSHEITLKIKFGYKDCDLPEEEELEIDSFQNLSSIDSVDLDSMETDSLESMATSESSLKSTDQEDQSGVSPAIVAAPVLIGAEEDEKAEELEGIGADQNVEDPSGKVSPMVVVGPYGLKKNELALIDQKIFFRFNSHKLLNKSEEILDSVAIILKAHPDIKLRVVGHTCNIGSEGQNAGISKDRAVAVKNYLRSKGISSSRMVTSGRGYTQPYLPNINERFRKLNRRVEFEIIDPR